jgi:hypothetical protein
MTEKDKEAMDKAMLKHFGESSSDLQQIRSFVAAWTLALEYSRDTDFRVRELLDRAHVLLFDAICLGTLDGAHAWLHEYKSFQSPSAGGAG